MSDEKAQSYAEAKAKLIQKVNVLLNDSIEEMRTDFKKTMSTEHVPVDLYIKQGEGWDVPQDIVVALLKKQIFNNQYTGENRGKRKFSGHVQRIISSIIGKFVRAV